MMVVSVKESTRMSRVPSSRVFNIKKGVKDVE